MNNANFKLALTGDTQVLVERFKEYNYDEEERYWHLQRYLKNLQPNPDTLKVLDGIIQSKIQELTLRGDKQDNNYEMSALSHMRTEFKRFNS